MEIFQILSITDDYVIVETVNETEDGKVILLRSYALENGGKLAVSSNHKFHLEESDILERKRKEVNDLTKYGKYKIRNIILNIEK